MRALITLLLIVCISAALTAQITVEECAGTAMPYPPPSEQPVPPEGFTPVFVNHLGRHGARFPTSDSRIKHLTSILEEGAAQNQLTTAGKELFTHLRQLEMLFTGQWGELTETGIGEQQQIARRMYARYPALFTAGAPVEAYSTYKSRCIASMEVFCNALRQEMPRLYIRQNHGTQYNSLLRFYDQSKAYLQYKDSGEWREIYRTFRDKTVPVDILPRYLNNSHTWTGQQKRDFTQALFETASILPCADIPSGFIVRFTPGESIALWQVGNLGQYLLKSTAPVGKMLPIEIAWPLLENFINTADSALQGLKKEVAVLRFAHAETVIPFAALMQIRTADPVIANADSVARYWQDFRISPMAANIQWIFYRNPAGKIQVEFLLNERPALLSLHTPTPPYYSWEEVRTFFQETIRRIKSGQSGF